MLGLISPLVHYQMGLLSSAFTSLPALCSYLTAFSETHRCFDSLRRLAGVLSLNNADSDSGRNSPLAIYKQPSGLRMKVLRNETLYIVILE